MSWLGDILNHYGKDSRISKFIARVVMLLSALFILTLVLVLINFKKIKKVWGVELSEETATPDTVIKYIPDTTNAIQLPSKSSNYPSQSAQKIKAPKQERHNVQNNGDVKNQNNGVNNGIIGDVTTDIPPPRFDLFEIDVNKKFDSLFMTSWEIHVDYRGSIKTLALLVKGENIVDIIGMNIVSPTTEYTISDKRVNTEEAIVLISNPSNKVILKAITSKPSVLKPFFEKNYSSF